MTTNNIQVPVQQTPTNSELLAIISQLSTRVNELSARVEELESGNLFKIFFVYILNIS